MNDLFGQPIVEALIPCAVKGKRKEKANGYPAQPGSGPIGETCKTCEHKTKIAISSNRKFWKCLKFRSPIAGTKAWPWSGCISSDIRLKSPACSLWEPAMSKTPKKFGLGTGPALAAKPGR